MSTTKRIYLAGPMSGYDQFNYPAFNEATHMLRDKGHVVCSPAEEDLEEYGEKNWMKDPNGNLAFAEENGFNLRDAMKKDLAWICEEADTIAMLPGWEHSYGARTEHALACCLDLEIMYL